MSVTWACPDCELDLALSDVACNYARRKPVEEGQDRKLWCKTYSRVNPGDLFVQNDVLWCLTCQKPLQHL